MHRIFTSLVAICCLAFSNFSTAQVTFSIVPTENQDDVVVGDTVTVNLDIANFVDMDGFQFSINWNATNLEFVNTHNYNLNGINAGSFNNPFPNALIVSWVSPTGSPFNSPDTTAFSMDFKILSSAGITAPISITGNPLTIEIYQNDEEITSSTVFNNGTATIPPTGGSTCNFGGGFGQVMTDASGETGEEVCLTVSACGFNDIISVQYSINFDPSLLQFSGTQNYNLPGLGPGLFNGNNSAGWVAFSWGDSLGVGVTVPDGDPLYDICFNIVGAGGNVADVTFTDNPTVIEVVDANSNGMHIGFDSDPGQVTITGSSGSAVTVVASSEAAPAGDVVCVQITGFNFDSIVGMQYSMHWDTAVIQYASIGNFAPFLTTNNFNDDPSFTDGGTLTFQYDGPPGGNSVNNGDTLYQVCFDVVGEVGEVSPFTFDGIPTTMEVTQVVDGSEIVVPLFTQSGDVTVLGEGLLTITASMEEVCPGDTVYVDFRAVNFNEVEGMQYDMRVDTDLLEYIDVINKAPDLIAMQVNQVPDGDIRLLWSDSQGGSVSLPGDTLLYSLCFVAIGADGTSSDVTWDYDFIIEIVGPDGAIPHQLVDGSVTITDNACDGITVSGTTTDVACFGENTGAIDITVSGATPPITYAWEATNGGSGLDPDAEDQSGLTAGTYSVTVTDNQSLTATESFTITEPGSALSASIAPTAATCNGGSDGSATANPTGGTAGYSYLWSVGGLTTQTITGLSAGQVCVTVTDNNGCTTSACENIGQGPAINVSFNTVNSECNSNTGSLTANPSGGAGPTWSYEWTGGQTSQTISGLAPGSYSVTVTDGNNCTTVASATVGTLAGPNVQIAMTQTSCNDTEDGELTANPSGGVPGYTYEWSEGGQTTATITGLPPGNYTVTVTDDAGCSTVEQGTVTSPDPVSPNASVDSDYNGEDISCNGGSDGEATADPSGGTAPYSYLWDHNNLTTQTISGLPEGDYTVTVTDDNSCTAVQTVSLTDPTGLSLNVNITHETSSGNDGSINLTVSGGTDPYDYNWDLPATSEDIAALSAGEYCVTVTDDNDCTATECYTVNGPNALTVNVENIVDESCFESNDGVIAISFDGVPNWTITWSDPQFNGQSVLTGLGQGTYSVTVEDGNGVQGVLSGIIVGGPTEQISYTIDQTSDVSCNDGADGSITILPAGGNGALYQVDWDNGAPSGATISGLSAGTYTPTITDSNDCTFVGTSITIDQPGPLEATLENTVHPGCGGQNDGSIDISVTGGTPPYQYDWMEGGQSLNLNPDDQDISGQGPGIYQCAITDANGCIAMTGQIELMQVGSPQIVSAEIIPLSCPNDLSGSINITVSGGSGIYDYIWLPNGQTTEDITGLDGGSYDVTITDSVTSCTTTLNDIIVSEPAPITITVNFVTPDSGNDDGAIDMNDPIGGSFPYTYEWNNGMTTLDISGLAAGTYCLTVTDANNCTIVHCEEVEGAFQIPDSGVTITDVSCAGGNDGSICVVPFGGCTSPPYAYLWSNGEITPCIEGLSADNYCVTITDCTGLTVTDCWDVGEPDLLTINSVNLVHETGDGCNGSININISGGIEPYTYLWSNGEISQDLDMLCKGSYEVTVTDANECVVVSAPIEILPPPVEVAMTTVTPALCAGSSDGQYCVDVIGGCSPYTAYLTATDSVVSIAGENICFGGLAAGTYAVTITDSDGSTNTPVVIDTFAITEPDSVLITIVNQINNTGGDDCNGAINIDVTGGVGGYAYEWSSSMGTSQDIDMLCGVNSPYSVTVTDANGCIGVLENIFIQDAPVVEASESNVSCFDECNGNIATTVDYGTPPFNYMWSTGDTTSGVFNLCAGSYDLTVTDANGISTTQSFLVEAPPTALTVDTLLTTRPHGANANGGINITVGGGWGNYDYMWSNGATSMDILGVEGGWYTVTVTDADGCQVIGNWYLDPIELVIEPSEIGNIDCYGDDNGFICVETSGGTAPYSYNWSVPGNNDACLYDIGPGTYYVTVNDVSGLLEQVVEFEVGQPDSLNIAFTTTDPGSACAIVTGGTEPYEYAWNNDENSTTSCIENQLTGDYDLVVVDANNCIAIATAAITEDLDDDCEEARTILTPNDDNKNETFDILCARIQDIDLLVFDRWGQLVFEAENYDNSWRGTDSSGDLLPEGPYYYVVRFTDRDGDERQTKGYLTLLHEE